MKKFFLVVIFLSSLFSLNETYAYTSTDVSNAQFLANQGIIVKSSTTAGYRLDDTITRAEVAGMALKVKGISLPNNYYCKNYFTDVKYDSTNNWICRAIELAADNGIITRTNTKARPQDKITRAEALAIIMKASGEEIGMGGEAGYKYYFDANLYGEGGVGYRNAYAFGANWQAETFYQYIRNIVKNDTLLKQNPLPNNNATRAEVFGFSKNILSSGDSCTIGDLQIKSPCEIDNGFIRYGQYIETTTYGDDIYKGPECLIRYEETGPNPINALTGLSLVKYRNDMLLGSYLDVQYIEAGGFRAVFTSTGYYRISSGGNIDNCTKIVLPNTVGLYPRDVLRLYYENLNTEGGSYWAYLMRSPAGVSLDTFRGWYEKVTKVSFQEDTLKNLGDNTYEFLVDMTENGIKSTYKVKSKVDLANFKINNLSSVKQ